MLLGGKRRMPNEVFFNLEKQNYNKMTISELWLQDESMTCNEKVILDQIEAYFKNLYSSENTLFQVESNTRNLTIVQKSEDFWMKIMIT